MSGFLLHANSAGHGKALSLSWLFGRSLPVPRCNRKEISACKGASWAYSDEISRRINWYNKTPTVRSGRNGAFKHKHSSCSDAKKPQHSNFFETSKPREQQSSACKPVLTYPGNMTRHSHPSELQPRLHNISKMRSTKMLKSFYIYIISSQDNIMTLVRLCHTQVGK